MRLFIAIRFDENMLRALKNTEQRLKDKGLKGRYQSEENLHLTLAFIGEYADPEEVLEVMEEVPGEPFSLRLEGYGNFRDVVWAGFSKCDELHRYVKRLRHALSEAGIPFDQKNFFPHVTLVRRAELSDGHVLPGIMVPMTTMKAEHISLMRSDRGKNGMHYTEIGTVHTATSVS